MVGKTTNRKIIGGIIAKAQQRIFEKTGQRILLLPVQKVDMSDLERVCVDVCNSWGITYEFISSKQRTLNRPMLRQIIWTVLKKRFPNAPLKYLAMTVGATDHAGVYHGLKRAKGLLESKDELFLKYYEPVKHMIDEQQRN